MDHVTTVTVAGHEREELNGDLTLHFPTVHESIRIEQRMAHLANPLKWEDLPPTGRGTTRMIATLEHVIDTAPSGWYKTKDGRPVLTLDTMSAADEDVLWKVYMAWSAALTTFRDARTGGATAVARDT